MGQGSSPPSLLYLATCRLGLGPAEEAEERTQAGKLGLCIGPVDLCVVVLKVPNELVENHSADTLHDPAEGRNDTEHAADNVPYAAVDEHFDSHDQACAAC